MVNAKLVIVAVASLVVGAGAGYEAHLVNVRSHTASSRSGFRGHHRPLGVVPGANRLGTVGDVATLSGSSIEVQSTSGQTTVNLTPTTSYKVVSSTTISALKIGECVRVTGPADSTGAVSAKSVTIAQSQNGVCRSPAPPG